MGNNKSSLRSLITDNIEKVRSVKNFYDEVESTIQLELKESRAALQFYKKTFHEQQKQVEHFRESAENLQRKIESILKANSNVAKQINDKIISLRKTRNPEQDKIISALKLVSIQLTHNMHNDIQTIKQIKKHSDRHISMMKELKEKFLKMTTRQQKNASKIQDAWKQFRRRIGMRRLRESSTESDAESSSDSDSSSVSSVGTDMRDLKLYGGRRRNRY